MNIAAIIKTIFTEQDNESWCPVRIFGIGFAILASTTYLALAVYTVVVLKQPIRYISMGTGLASVWGTVSAAIIFKGKFVEKRP